MMVPAVILIALMPLVALAMVTFNRLVRHLAATHPTAWQEAGRPLRFYEFAWGPGTLTRSFAAQKASALWLFRTPKWAQEDEVALRLLRRYRFVVAAWNIGVILVLCLLLRLLGPWAG
jgi:hypothetical protein